MATQTFERNLSEGSFNTHRNDKWWLFPTVYASIIILFIIYTTIALLIGTDSYKVVTEAGVHFISPIFGFEIPESILAAISWPASIPPAYLLILAPIGFRATCYYERKVYYRSFFGNPPACGVDGVSLRRGKYTGERWLPFVLNNFHRYFFYAVVVLTIIQNIDFLIPLQYGVGIGNLIFFVNALFISLYVFSCHSFRHLAGGNSNCYSCGGVEAVKHKSWSFISKINARHGTWFWFSLITVMVTDLYVRLLYYNVIPDIMFITF